MQGFSIPAVPVVETVIPNPKLRLLDQEFAPCLPGRTMPEGTRRTSNAQHRTPNLEPMERERAMSADYDLEECAQHPNG